jgi:hypothetical protein
VRPPPHPPTRQPGGRPGQGDHRGGHDGDGEGEEHDVPPAGAAGQEGLGRAPEAVENRAGHGQPGEPAHLDGGEQLGPQPAALAVEGGVDLPCRHGIRP